MEKKFLKITIMAIMLVLVYSTIVSALSFTATMTPSSTTVAESTEFTVTVKIANLDVGTTGINAFSAKLEYDTGIFETVNASSFTGLNGWTVNYQADTNMIVLTKLSFVKSEEDLFQITFKTKSGNGVNGKTGSIKLTEVKASDPSNDIEAADVSTSIAVGTTNENTSNTTNNPPSISANTSKNNTVNNTANKTSNNVVKNNTINNTAKNNTTNKTGNNVTNSSSSDIPYTGTEDTIIKAIFVVIAIALVFYIKFEKINKEMK